MNANRIAWALLFLMLGVAGAQQPTSAIETNAATTNATNDERIGQTKAKADRGDKRAQYMLGLCYFRGDGVAKDAAEGLKWWRKSADQGDAEAEYQLGLLYRDGHSVTKDETEAVRWLRLAALQRHVKAQYELALLYRYSDGMEKNSKEAVKWFQKTAEQGYMWGQYELGYCYLNGDGVPQNSAKAIEWFRKVADREIPEGQFELGMIYHSGQGVPQDYVEALKWFRKAASLGHGGAQANLGAMYASGVGVPQDYIQAYKWHILAASQGIGIAAKNRDELLGFMSREQVAEAQRLAREFTPRKAPASDQSRSDKAIDSPNSKASGTGFFITPDGFFVSNAHVVEGATQVRLVTSAGLISAKVVKVDAANDLALLKAEGRFAPLPVATSRGVKLGGTVATVGFPNIGLQGFAPKLAKGEIASLSGAGDDARYFQISVPVQPGNSGGALVDERGNVVGVVSAKLSAKAALAASGSLPENVNYAVKSGYLLACLESVPELASKLKEPQTKDKKFEDVVKEAEQAAVLVLVY